MITAAMIFGANSNSEKKVNKELLKQMEYYMSDANLKIDGFFREKIE